MRDHDRTLDRARNQINAARRALRLGDPKRLSHIEDEHGITSEQVHDEIRAGRASS